MPHPAQLAVSHAFPCVRVSLTSASIYSNPAGGGSPPRKSNAVRNRVQKPQSGMDALPSYRHQYKSATTVSPAPAELPNDSLAYRDRGPVGMGLAFRQERQILARAKSTKLFVVARPQLLAKWLVGAIVFLSLFLFSAPCASFRTR